MGGAPTIITIRPGVQFEPGACDSFRRLEAEFKRRAGRDIRCSSSYRDYGLQLSMWQAWTAWTEGRGPKPNHSRAIHPDDSQHCKGLAFDTPDWAALRAFCQNYGWYWVSDPTEQHHLEYRWWLDKHRGEPIPASVDIEIPTPVEEEEDMPTILSSGIGQSLEIGGILVSFTHPDEVTATKGAKVVETTSAVHSRVVAEYARRSAIGFPLIVNVPNGNGTQFSLENGRLTAIADPATRDAYLARGAQWIELSQAEVSNMLAQQAA